MITPLREFTNKVGTVYNPERTSTFFAEDMNLLGANDVDLQDQIDNLGEATQWLSAAGAPSDSEGENNDFYLNSTNGDYYKKVGGTWGAPLGNLKGPEGEQGEQGEPGEDGAPGTDGTNGTNGTNGAPGAVWFNGTVVPSSGGGINGDYYLRTTTADVYFKSGGTWSIVANIKGATGTTGATGAAGAPGSKIYTVAESDIPLPSGFGVVGDYAITEDIGRLYRKTGVSTWSLMFIIRSNVYNEIGMTMVGYNTLAAPADNTLYYYGSQGFTASSTRVYYEMPYGGVRSGLIKKIYLKTKVTGTLASTESTAVIRLYVNGSNVAQLTGQQLFNTADGMIEWDNIDYDVAPGDDVCIGIVTPTWATNPTTTYIWSTISILPELF